MQQRRLHLRLGEYKQGNAEGRRQQQADIHHAEASMSHGHRQRIGGQRQGQQQSADPIQAAPGCVPILTIRRQEASGEQEIHDPKGNVDQENGFPAEAGDQDAPERWSEGGADRGHGAQQAHGAAGPFLRHGFANHGDGQRHHHGGTKALQGSGGNQQRQRRR